MKKGFQQLTSTIMAILLLLSTVSWTVDKHLCMGRVMDIALFASAEDCGMKTTMQLRESSDVQNHCCDDESFTLEGQDDLKLSWTDINLNQQVFIFAFTTSFLNELEPQSSKSISSETYPPPLLVRDKLVLHQKFLI